MIKGQLQPKFFIAEYLWISYLYLDFLFLFQIYMCQTLLKQLLVKKATLMIILFCGRPEVYNKFTMEMVFTFWEEGCDWSISSMMWRMATSCICGVWPHIIPKFTMEMVFTFWEEGCDWSISSMMWRMATSCICGVWPHIIPKLVPSCFGLKIECTFSSKHFVLVTCIQTSVYVWF